MSDLNRQLAPIPPEAWQALEDEARDALKTTLSARRLVDFNGPLGWRASSVDLGRTRDVSSPVAGAEARLRKVQPLVEIRVPFVLARREIDAITRGAPDPDVEPLVNAARAAARAEDSAVFSGYPEAGIDGIGSASPHAPISLTHDYAKYPEAAAEAVRVLRNQGIGGPYAIALGPRCYTGLTRTTHSGGYPVIEHLKKVVDGPLVYAPAVDGSVLLSMRGGDFVLTVGRDFSIGYLNHDGETVTLYLEFSFTFRNNGPDAAVPLIYTTGKGKKD